jgi:tetratricopeptide (TPR) repeat protein
VDETFLAWCGSRGPSLYKALYYPHNVHFLWSAASMEGQSGLALTSARRLVSLLSEETLDAYPLAEEFLPTPIFTLARFGRWDAILGEPAPAPKRRFTTGVWHYARGLARLRTGDPAGAETELAAVRAILGEEALRTQEFSVGKADTYLAVGERHLAGELAAARGDLPGAIAALEESVRLQDALRYTEPPPWYLPQRQALGAVLLQAGRAAEADAVYRADLARLPANGWSLFGLAQSLRAEGKPTEAAMAEEGFRHAWARADVTLPASRF